MMKPDETTSVRVRRVLFLVWGQQPNELAVKKLAMFGCAALVYAHAVKHRIAANTYAGVPPLPWLSLCAPWLPSSVLRQSLDPRPSGSCASHAARTPRLCLTTCGGRAHRRAAAAGA